MALGEIDLRDFVVVGLGLLLVGTSTFALSYFLLCAMTGKME